MHEPHHVAQKLTSVTCPLVPLRSFFEPCRIHLVQGEQVQRSTCVPPLLSARFFPTTSSSSQRRRCVLYGYVFACQQRVDRVLGIMGLDHLDTVAVVEAAFIAEAAALVEDKDVRCCLRSICAGYF